MQIKVVDSVFWKWYIVIFFLWMTFQILHMFLNDVPSLFNQLAYAATQQVSVCILKFGLILYHETK